MEMLILLVILFALAIGGYYGICHIIMLYSGCDFDGAVKKLNNLVNGKAVYTINNDPSFIVAIEDNVRNIIGEKRYAQLIQLSQAAIGAPLLTFGSCDGMSCVNICMYYKDENEQQVLETVLCNVVRTYLRNYGQCEKILAEWRVRDDLKMPYLQIRYAKNKSELNALQTELYRSAQKVIVQNSSVTDDMDEEELDE